MARGTVTVFGDFTNDLPCADKTGLFYSVDHENIARAKQICAGCVMRAPCLQKALDDREEHGIWGGLTPDERSFFRMVHGNVVGPEVPDVSASVIAAYIEEKRSA